MSEKLVRNVMHEGLISCWEDETLIEVAQRMCDDSINAIFVMNDNGHARGIVSQTDLVEAYLQGDWLEQTAGDIMNSDIVTIVGDEPLNLAIGMMLNRNIHRLLVVQDEITNRPIGVLSMSDVVCEMAGEMSLLDQDEMELIE